MHVLKIFLPMLIQTALQVAVKGLPPSLSCPDAGSLQFLEDTSGERCSAHEQAYAVCAYLLFVFFFYTNCNNLRSVLFKTLIYLLFCGRTYKDPPFLLTISRRGGPTSFLGCFTCFCLLVCSDRQSCMNILVPTYLLTSVSISVEEIPKRGLTG